jgi:hypothetical protein
VSAAEDLEYQRTLRGYSGSFMSNAKWLKLFRALLQAGIQIERAQWQLLGTTHSIWQSFPSERDLTPTGFADGKFQPLEYKWIEAVFIPHCYRPDPSVGFEKVQSTSQFVAALELAGKFPLEESSTGVTIRAYRKRTDG